MKFYCDSRNKDYLEISSCGDRFSLEVVCGEYTNDVILNIDDIDILISELYSIKKEIVNEK